MILRVFIAVLMGIGPLTAQTTFPSTLYEDVLKTYMLQNQEFHGVFDSTDSYFVVHFDSVNQSVFDPTALLAAGKTWHRGQTVPFKAYFSLDTFEKMEAAQVVISESDPTDTISQPHWAFGTETMKISGTELWHCAGELRMAEDTAQEYSGIFTAMVEIYFYYRPKNGYIKPLPSAMGFGIEPSFGVMGEWQAFKHTELGNISFCLANTPFIFGATHNTLPDFRIQADGTASFSNSAYFEFSCSKPPPKWYQ
jgi:hypothetical protein